MRCRSLICILSFFAAFQSAQAADVAEPKNPSHVSSRFAADKSQSYDWTGPYLGASVGYAFNTHITGGLFGYGDSGFTDATGALGGAYAGYNWQKENWVIGAEVMFEAANIFSTHTFNVTPTSYWTLKPEMSHIGTIRARVGYAFDRALFYGTGGAGLTTLRISLPAGSAYYDQTRDYTGYTLGGGMEYALTNHWAGRLDYSYYNFGKQRSGEHSDDYISKLTASAVRGGLAYKF